MTQVPPVEISLRERRKQEVRSRINDAAIELFSEYGCEPVTVEEICEAAQVARKTFYNYYQNKQELLNELTDALLINETFNRIDMAMERYDSTAERLQYYFETMSENMHTASDLERELVLQSVFAIASNTEESGEKLSRLNECFSRVFVEGQAQGDVIDSYSPEFLADMMVGAINGITLNWVHDKNYPVVQRVHDLSKMMTEFFTK